jgi:hypothetical protein
VRTVFLSNTYPIHVSAVTGKTPGEHGVVSNTEPYPGRHPAWNTDAGQIQATTLWQAAHGAGLNVAAVLWPCTGRSPHIRWNIPEIMPMPGKNQVWENLKAGSKWLQLRLVLRHGKALEGIRQPALDEFATACMVDILREKKPDLALMHLTCYDSLCHIHGRDREKLAPAYESLDRNLGKLLDAAGEDMNVIVFSDHGQFDVGRVLTPNAWLEGMGLIRGDGGWRSDRGCFIECCGGSAFFWPGFLGADEIDRARELVAASEGFGRFLTRAEMSECGREALPFGFAARVGYCYKAFAKEERGEHGYPTDYPEYEVFYAVRRTGQGDKAAGCDDHTKARDTDEGDTDESDKVANGAKAGDMESGNKRDANQCPKPSILDIAPIAAEILGIPWG